MLISAVVILLYLIANISIALLVNRIQARGQEGFSGAGYRLGYAFYPLMAFGTGFMELSFAIIDIPLRHLAKERNYITPSGFVNDRYKTPSLSKTFSLMLAIFTMPYLALQGMFVGKIIQFFVGISYEAGCLLVLSVAMIYVCIIGLRAVD